MPSTEVMSLCRYLAKKPLPTADQTGIEKQATSSANARDEKALVNDHQEDSEVFVSYTDEDRVKIGKLTIENGNAAAIKHMLQSTLGGSTVSSR